MLGTMEWKEKIQWDGSLGLEIQNRKGVSGATKRVKKIEKVKSPRRSRAVGWSWTGEG